MSYKKWIINEADKEKASHLSEQMNIDAFIAFLLVSRGVDNELTASEFLSDSSRFSSPYSFKDMDKAVKRINTALDEGEGICIFGDYDCDGVTATALLYTFLQAMGGNVSYYIPNRITDGYGMNFGAIDKIKANHTDLIITVDNGISSIEEAEYIYSKGMQLIVTDHHQIGDKLPKAEAVINPHREDNDLTFRDFAGVGVAFKLACALYGGDIEELVGMFADYVAIGTIGDMVSLMSENRTLVKAGLKLINEDAKIGISALKKIANSNGEMSSYDVAFQLCPRINAAGRMDSAEIALKLLISDDEEDAEFRASQLNIENEHRHEVEDNIAKDVASIIEKDKSYGEDRVIVVAGNNYHKGVIGINASHIVENYGKPAIVIGIDDEGIATGSARSIEGFNIYEALSSCSELLYHFGGHPLAAGMSLEAKNISAFRKAINEYAKKNYPVMPVQSIKLDCKLSPFYLNVDLVDNLSVLEPYGTSNSQPVFGLFNMTLSSVTPIGDGKHIRLEAVKKGKTVRMVKFKTTVDEFPYKVGDSLDFAVRVSKNLFKGKMYLSVQIVDYHKHGIDIDKYYLQKNDYELFLLGNKNKTEVYPSRDICSVIYRYLKRSNGYKFSVDDLYFELASFVTYAQLCFALDAFEETGLITRNGAISINEVKTKKDLEKTNVLTVLKGRL
ncbi:MAG: single-stranded-DNA-specific exonuclease RecJ [Eubacteriales bacterium]|nr:single-stranded-DNA-specific exonuclease RecJ [Eubacteriales bacterium]